VIEIKQMCGRAGRPRYDKEGEAILLARSEDEVEELMEEYIYADPERIFSKLGAEPALRVHLLAAIATGFVNGEADLDAFLASTFLAHQTNAWDLKGPVDAVLEFLHEHELIKRSGADLRATALGRRVSELYIDPLSAVIFIDALDRMGKRRITERSFLHLVSAVPDSTPLYMRESEWGWVQDLVEREADSFLVENIEELKSDESFLAQVKTAEVLEFWIDEMSLDAICTKFDIGPGDLRTRIDTARWLLYSLREVAKATDQGPLRDVIDLSRRVVNGVKRELLPVVAFRGIGRIKGRHLFARGYRSAQDIRKASAADLAKVPLIGPRLAESIKREAETQGPSREADAPRAQEEEIPADPSRTQAEAPAGETPKNRSKARKTSATSTRAPDGRRRQQKLGEWKD
jgi:helicase